MKVPKPPSAGHIPPESRITREETPRRAGLVSNVKHVLGFSPRKARLTAMPGTNPAHNPAELGGLKMKMRRPGGMTSGTAPFKHQVTSAGNAVQPGVLGPGMDEPV